MGLKARVTNPCQNVRCAPRRPRASLTEMSPTPKAAALRIEQASTPVQIESTRALFREYQAFLGVDLCFQSFDAELAGLPGDYAPPSGRLLLAYWEGNLSGCVGLRRLEDGVCEMKRLFVRPAFHGKAIGWELAQAIVREAQAAGYQRMRLDTLPSMQKAQAMYGTLGFRDIAPYCANPIAGARYLEKLL